MKMASVPIEEQETVAQISRDERIAHIYTSDRRMITRLDKRYPRAREDISGGEVRAVYYDVPESLVSFRSSPDIKPNMPKKQMTERQLQVLQKMNAKNQGAGNR